MIDPTDHDGLSRPKTKAGRIQRATLALMAEHERDGALPTSNRFLFYELEGRGMIEKAYRYADGRLKPRQPAQDVSEALMRLRELGLVWWEHIVDETRSLDAFSYAETIKAGVLENLPHRRIDLWEGEAPPLILCESRSLAGVLRHIAADYLCPIAATNGQVGGFLHTEVGPLIADAPGWGDQRVLYFGDRDLSGGHIEENTREVLLGYAPLEWTRLAITDVQVRAHDLTAIDKPDHRYKPVRTFPAYETESLSQREIQRILTEHLDAMLPEPLAVVKAREAEQRVQVREALDELLGDEDE
jgi:hypothetical protein